MLGTCECDSRTCYFATLFDPESDHDHLARMKERLGEFPQPLATCGARTEKLFKHDDGLSRAILRRSILYCFRQGRRPLEPKSLFDKP